jgi:5-methylcytosine-specific restriction endonuclease McrA
MPTINLRVISQKKTVANIYQEKEDICATTKNVSAIYHSRTWERLKKARIMMHPVCERCGKNLSEEVHHKVPLPRGGTLLQLKTVGFDPNNIMALCKKCHQDEHKKH